MSLKDIIELAKAGGRCGIGALVILMVGGVGGGIWLWDQKDKLEEGNKNLLKDKADFYKEESAAAVHRAASDSELNKRESEIGEREKSYEQNKQNLDAREAALTENQSKIQDYASALSFAAQQNKAREQISQMMREFASLGVQIGQHPSCSDVEGSKKYNQAVSIVSAIRALAIAGSMQNSYQTFINDNTSGMSISCSRQAEDAH